MTVQSASRSHPTRIDDRQNTPTILQSVPKLRPKHSDSVDDQSTYPKYVQKDPQYVQVRPQDPWIIVHQELFDQIRSKAM